MASQKRSDKMRKDNKLFIKSMIITSIIGFSVLMITMFIGIKYYVDKNETSHNIKQADKALIDTEEPKVEYSNNVIALVKNIQEDRLIALDIEKEQLVDKNITTATKVSDEYGGVIPLSSVQPGDIVEVVFQPDKQNILSINKTSRSWIKKDISGVIINSTANEAVIGKETYKLTEDAFLFKEGGLSISPSFIGEYDIVQVQGIENTIWSIKVLKSGASIELLDIPSEEGLLEIDRTRMIPLKEVIGPVGITSGKHKILVNIKGYEELVKEVTLTPEENYQISLKGMKEAFTELKLGVANVGIDYTVQVGDKLFQKGQKISVKQGKYKVAVKAEGYEDWVQELEFDTPIYDLNVMLQKEAEETTEPDTTDTTNPSGETANNDNTSNASNGSYTVNISTDPSGAHVYFGGVYKGETPFKATLPIGDYAVSLEKDGFQTYNTTIIIDNSDNQNSFLYVLTPR